MDRETARRVAEPARSGHGAATMASPVPALLRPDNFTARERTPWGGERIARLKAGLGVQPQRVGEAWELSLGPELPSTLADGRRLDHVVEGDRARWLGDGIDRARLLVKLLDAEKPLSVQIHPHEDDPLLAADESGKPELWYIVDADPGAFVLFGLSDGATEGAMRSLLEAGGDVSTLFSRVEVAPGDLFVVDAGTPHAVGAGVTLLEPQIVMPEKRGVTYRYWDWGRRYDARGIEDPGGRSRELHVADALRVTDWSGPRGAALLDRAHHRYVSDRATRRDHALRLEALAGREAPVHSRFVEVSRLIGSGRASFEMPTRVLRSITVLDGHLIVGGSDLPSVEVGPGATIAIPAIVDRLSLDARQVHAVLTYGV